MKNLYIIAGPNGAGKTTLSYTILPEIFDCYEFVNADEIAKGLSPLNPESTALKAGRLMLERINELMQRGESFAFETTLATKSYVGLVKRAQSLGYKVTLLFLALNSSDLAVQRVTVRVDEGGHNIPKDVIIRRFQNGLTNLFRLYIPVVDRWILVDNSKESFGVIAEGSQKDLSLKNKRKWENLNKLYNGG